MDKKQIAKEFTKWITKEATFNVPLTLTKGATLWMTGKNGTALYVKPNGMGYDWIMISPNTGSHVIKQKGGLEPEMTERVKAHWCGFQTNQTRLGR